MANSRPESLIIPSGVFDETNSNNILKKQSVPINARSSSSSIESTSGKNVNINEQNSLPQTLLNTTSSTTTDSDFESEQDDKQQKTESNTSDQVSRRVRHFHKLFKTELPNPLPELINSYVCAYQGDILLQGKMYITDRYLCFHSRIINYVTKHVYRWEQIESVRKERVAFIFPTAICIQLKQTGKKIIYASFLQRDQAYEKILSIWSRSTNETHSYDDEDSPQDGTLKANNHQEKIKDFNRASYEIADQNEQDVLQMCLKQNSKRASSVPRKIHEEKHSTKKSMHLYEKKLPSKTSNQNQKLSNNQTTRRSRNPKTEQNSNDTLTTNHRLQSTSPQNSTEEILSHSNSSSTIIPNTNSSIINPNSNRILSFVDQIKSYISSYSMKTMLIILLILTILFFHSFYLIKLTYRIENRLQLLHHQWPSSMKNSFPSNSKEL